MKYHILLYSSVFSSATRRREERTRTYIKGVTREEKDTRDTKAAGEQSERRDTTGASSIPMDIVAQYVGL